MTSDWVAALRALYSRAPEDLALVDDPVALDLLPPWLRLPVRALGAFPDMTRMSHRLLGLVTLGLTYDVPLRTAAIDEVLRENLEQGAQFVLLGAGLDARAWRMAELAPAIVFEVDHPDTQRYKRERIGERPPLAHGVRFCAIDFERAKGIDDVLIKAGFDPSKPSVWLWEGVTMYLSHDAIEKTIEAISRLSAPASRLLLTYVTPDHGPFFVRAAGSVAAFVIGESLRGKMDRADICWRLGAHGFVVKSDDSAVEWAVRYWPSREASHAREWERLLVAVRQ